jgi:small subunit ribosomal protein S21
MGVRGGRPDLVLGQGGVQAIGVRTVVFLKKKLNRTNFFVIWPDLFIFATLNYSKEVFHMLIIDSKDCENIDKALKKYKKKFEKAKILLQLRERQSFTKPSIKRRAEVLKAVYKQQIAAGKIDS